MCRRLEAAGIDVLSIDQGCTDTTPFVVPPAYFPHGLWLEDVAAVKRAVRIPVITSGNNFRPEFAEKILADGVADFVLMPPVLKDICKRERGFVLCTGPTGSGKSTTLAAMVDFINETQDVSIITIEDPIEFVHRSKRGLVNQREIGMEYAVVRTGGKQYRVSPGDLVEVERFPAERGATVELGEVLLTSTGGTVRVGTPIVAGARVTAKVVEHTRGKKILVFKMKRRKNERRKRGHRQDITTMRVLEIVG